MRLRMFLLSLALLVAGAAVAGAEGPPAAAGQPPLDPSAIVKQQAKNLDTRALDGFLREMNQTWQGYGPDISLNDFLEVYRGDSQSKYSPVAILSGFTRYLVREVLANAGLLAKLVTLAVAAALLQQMQTAFDNDATGKLAHSVIYIMLMGLAITGFGLAVATAKAVIEQLSGFMHAMLPTLLALLASMGGLTSTAIFHPLMVTLTTTAATIMMTIVFPLVFLAAVLDIVSGLNENFKLTNLAGLLRQGAQYVLGGTFTIFLGVVAVKGAAGAVADGVTMKTAKFVLSSFIPVVGKMFSDATDLIFGSSLLLKNALGMFGAAAVLFIVAFPLLKILSLVVVYQVAASLVEPVGAGQVAKMLGAMSKSLQMIFAAVAVVALMFFVAITVIVGAGNVTVMMR